MSHVPSDPILFEKARFKDAVVYLVDGHPEIAVVQAISPYIPIAQFKEIFNFMTDFISAQHVQKLIFDKRLLTVFHQPSMEWYFVEWKEIMFGHGLKIHRKILPEDTIFRQSVKIGRDKISREHPQGKFMEMDIAYAESLQDAIDK